jgi:hypothetical protein
MYPRPSRRPRYTATLLVGGLVVAWALAASSTGSASSPPQESTMSRSTPTPRAVAAARTGNVRPFRAASYWNRPLGRAPQDPKSRRYIRDAQVSAHSQGYLKLVLGAWGMPTYRSGAADTVYRINPTSGPTVRVHIPRGARPMPTSDAALTVNDRASHQVVGLGGARFHRATQRWTARTVSRYGSTTNGIAQGLRGGTRGNLGHRGIPGSVQSVTMREIRRGAINHRLEVYWWETRSRTPAGHEAYFPMTGSEAGKVGVVPEGIVIRIRAAVDLTRKHLSPAAYTVARALQRYGAVVGDNSGTGNSLKLQANADWSGVLAKDSLRSIPWRDYTFVTGGYRP